MYPKTSSTDRVDINSTRLNAVGKCKTDYTDISFVTQRIMYYSKRTMSDINNKIYTQECMCFSLINLFFDFFWLIHFLRWFILPSGFSKCWKKYHCIKWNRRLFNVFFFGFLIGLSKIDTIFPNFLSNIILLGILYNLSSELVQNVLISSLSIQLIKVFRLSKFNTYLKSNISNPVQLWAILSSFFILLPMS